jgi:hypothetical protein
MMRWLFAIFLFELFVGGGGRFTALGAVSLRMLLFAGCIAATIVALLFPRRSSNGLLLALGLVLVYLLVHVFGLVVGAIHGNDPVRMLTEFQQSAFWLAAPFFALMIQTERDVERYARLVQIAGVTLSLVYIAMLAGLVSGLLPLSLVRALIAKSGEISFRSSEFFIYKGFLYLGIATVFFAAIRGKYWVPLAALTAIAMVLTFTRGFVISASVSILLLLCLQGRWNTAIPALVGTAVAAFFVWIYQTADRADVSARLDASTNQRIEDMTFMFYNVRPSTLLFGEGYGSLINNRYAIENVFLWAPWKLGVVGLSFWLTPLVICIHFYLKVADWRTNKFANAYLFGTILVYVQSLTNPFLNNPIGLAFVLLALFSLRILSQRQLEGARSPDAAGPSSAQQIALRSELSAIQP